MTAGLTVARNETGVVRVFVVQAPKRDLQRWKSGDAERIGAALGTGRIDPDYVEVIDPRDLQPIGLTGYLVEGMGVPPDALADATARLEALDDPVLIVLSGAFGGSEVTLDPAPEVTFLARFSDPAAPPSFEPIQSDAARGIVDPPSNPAPGLMQFPIWLTLAGIVLCGIVIAIVFL